MEDRLNILFVVSGNSKNFIMAPFILSQGESLKSYNVNIDYFRVVGRGLSGYLRNIHSLRKKLKYSNFDLIHAHYTLSSWVAILASSGLPIIVSLMGSDVYGEYKSDGRRKITSYYLVVLSKILQLFVNHIIVKSANLANSIFLRKKFTVIPNGVNLNTFNLMEKNKARELLNISLHKKIILFLGDPNYPRKNFILVKKSMCFCNIKNIELLVPFPVESNKIPIYLNAADLLILTSLNEGSPNVIKEAMACNCPVVATDVGDVRWLFGNEPGHFITSFEPEDVAEKIKLALEFSAKVGRTNGRERIIELGLDSETVAKKVISIYKRVLRTAE